MHEYSPEAMFMLYKNICQENKISPWSLNKFCKLNDCSRIDKEYELLRMHLKVQ